MERASAARLPGICSRLLFPETARPTWENGKAGSAFPTYSPRPRAIGSSFDSRGLRFSFGVHNRRRSTFAVSPPSRYPVAGKGKIVKEPELRAGSLLFRFQ